jgi:hypothetical protein
MNHRAGPRRTPTLSIVTEDQAPTLLFVIGPPAVGKMTVGQAIADRTGLKLFHNHMTIEPLLRLFPFESPQFRRLVSGFRRQIFEEVAASTLPGLVFTYVWAFGEPGEAEAVEHFAAPFRARGGRVLFLELTADQATRLERNTGATRLAEKPSKRDLSWSSANLRELDAKYRLTSTDDFAGRDDHLLIDNTSLSPDEVAMAAIERFGL